jgi:hypothetical protein
MKKLRMKKDPHSSWYVGLSRRRTMGDGEGAIRPGGGRWGLPYGKLVARRDS